jgi:hypothetical protein
VKPVCSLLKETLLQLENPVANVLTELLERNVFPEMTEYVSSSSKSPRDTDGGAVMTSTAAVGS